MKQKPIRIDDYLRHGGNTNFRYLITAVSYEDRGFLSVKNILEYFKIEKVALILFRKDYLDKKLQKKWGNQEKMIKDTFNKYRIECIELNCDPLLFNNSIEEIKNITKNELPNIINISSLPKNYILRLAKEFDDERNIFLYYRGKYREPTEKELETAIKKIIPVEGFEGIRELTAEDLLVLILGYEGHRALSFLSKFSPFKILPLIGIPNQGNKKLDDEFYNNVVKCNWNLLRKHSILKKNDGTFYTTSSLHHLNFSIELEDVIKNYRKDNEIDICISPLGTKAQALGLYLYWRKNPDTQIVYSVPIKRFDITVKNEGKAWIYKLPPKVEL